MPDSTVPLLLVALPASGALLIPALHGQDPRLPRRVAMAVMLAVLLLSLYTLREYDAIGASARFDFNFPWIPSLDINLHLGVDGFNLYLLLLCAVLFAVALGCLWNRPQSQRPLFLALILFLQASLIGTFLSQNLALFFVFWEAVLIPMSVLILVFGGERRRDAATTFFLYTLAGSVLLLAAVIALGAECLRQTGSWSFELQVLHGLQLGWNTQRFVFIAIMVACAVKCPLVPFHSWLPLAYCEAPAALSALMAGVLSKMGTFILLKLALPLAPDVAIAAAPGMVWLAVTSILYGAILALRQQDYKKLVAYSSLSHMGYIVLGIFSWQQLAIHGSLLQMLSHGMAVAGLFLLLGLLEEQRGPAYTRLTAVAAMAPRHATVLMLFILTSVALPLTSGFTAEFLILFGAFLQGLAAWRAELGSHLLIAAVLASTAMVLGAGYMLRFARAILFGKNAGASTLRDLNLRETMLLGLPLLFVFWIGIAPATLMNKVQTAASQLARIPATVGPPPSPAVVDAGNPHGK